MDNIKCRFCNPKLYDLDKVPSFICKKHQAEFTKHAKNLLKIIKTKHNAQ